MTNVQIDPIIASIHKVEQPTRNRNKWGFGFKWKFNVSCSKDGLSLPVRLGPVHMDWNIWQIFILFAKCSYYLANKYTNLQASVTLFAHVNAALKTFL